MRYHEPLIIKRVVVAFETVDGIRGYITGNVTSTTNIIAISESYGGTHTKSDIKVNDLADITFLNNADAQPALEQIGKALDP